ncbi:hypothetical protein HDU96_009101 [Phlyctochytrium bullatum]|nr:hypothetical protein HDU96_009101 [Phlyctochytrium bullatum]
MAEQAQRHDGATALTVPAAFPEILKDLNREVLRHQPKDIYQFCATYFHKKLAEQRSKLGGAPHNETHHAHETHDAPSDPANEPVPDSVEANAEASEQQDVVTDDLLPTTERPTGSARPRSLSAMVHHEDEAEEEEEEEDDDEAAEAEDHIAPPPPPTMNYNRGRRTSVSAESMAPSTDANYERVVIPKTDEQRSRIDASIRSNFLFRACDEEQYADVVAAMSEKRVTPGEEVIRQGGVGDFFYVVEEGTLDVLVSRNGQPPIKVTDYGAGGSFGELALMYNAPRAATVIATSDCVLWALDRVTFRRILMENTSRKRRMYEAFLEEVPLLVSLEPYERHKIADALESVVFNDGDVVIKQGDLGENFYIIESGEARVTQTDASGVEHELPGLKKGDYFGELALLTNQPRKATVSANGRLKLATLGKKAFVRLLGPVVNIIKRNIDNYSSIAAAFASQATQK